MGKKLTKMVLEQRAPTSGRVEVRDSDSPLVFRLTSQNNRSLCVRTRIDGRQVRLTYPKAAHIENLSEARSWARQAVDASTAGIDPRVAEHEAAEAAKRATAKKEGQSIEIIIEKYVKRRVRREKQNRTADETERLFGLYVLPRWRGRRVHDISRADVNDLLDMIYDRKLAGPDGKLYGSPVTADHVLAQLRACFNWYAIQDDKFVSPIVRGMNRTNPRKLARDRVLSDDEIRALWASLPGQHKVYRSILQMLLLTGQRRDEVAALSYTELDGDLWTIPAERYKTGKANSVPLSATTRAIIADQDKFGGCDLVFTTNGVSPFSGFSKCKRALDDAMLEKLREFASDRGMESEKVTLTPWRIHDLRRTAKTLMARSGVRPDVSERVLGHVISGVEGVYDRYDYVEEKRLALEALASMVARIITPPGDNVVALREAAE